MWKGSDWDPPVDDKMRYDEADGKWCWPCGGQLELLFVRVGATDTCDVIRLKL